MTVGIHVQMAVSPCENCPVAVLSERMTLEKVRVDPVDGRIEFVACDRPDDPPNDLETVEFAGESYGRYELSRSTAAGDGGVRTGDGGVRTGDGGVRTGDGGVRTDDGGVRTDDGGVREDDRAGDCVCSGLPSAFETFPVLPRETRIDDGELFVSFVLTGHEELEAIVDGFEAAGLHVEIRRLIIDRSTDDDRADVVPIDLTGVTDRQAEVAATAVEHGYFDPDGPTAEEIAAELDLAKSTVSEHLRLVTATLFSQLFADGGI